MAKLVTLNISESSRLQRKGRVGRTGPGHVYYTYKKGLMENNKILFEFSTGNISDVIFSSIQEKLNENQITLANLLKNKQIKEQFFSLYNTSKGVFNYRGNPTQYDYDYDKKYVPQKFDTGYDSKTLYDANGNFYIVHPEELYIERDLMGRIKASLKKDINYKNGDITLKFRLALTSFKHLGIFPEQAVNWDYIIKCIGSFKTEQPKVLNLFAYTGGASLAACAAGAETTHVDSIKQVVSWANENQTLSGLENIRWTVEDALKFVKREVKRGRKYNGIILDPPAYGHGPNGEKWKLEDNIKEMMEDVVKLLDDEEHFLILNTYSLGFSSIIVENLIRSSFPKVQNLESGELYLQASSGYKLPLGVFGKFCKI